MKQRQPLPWRVFGFIGLLIVVTAFSALNLDHRSDVSLGFHTFDGVPVFLTSLVAFTLGAVLAVLLTLPRHRAVPRALPPAPQLGDTPPAEDAPHSDAAAVTPAAPAEGDGEERVERLDEPSDRQARRWRFGRRRRKEAED